MIGIKDFDMPYNCYDCELHNYHECNLTSESIEDDYCWNGDSREKHCPLVEAIPIDQYENRLKVDMIAILTEIKLKITEKSYYDTMIIGNYEDEVRIDLVELDDVNDIIQEKINALKENGDATN